jgi:quercetin dioxygenase-like cupin family protein
MAVRVETGVEQAQCSTGRAAWDLAWVATLNQGNAMTENSPAQSGTPQVHGLTRTDLQRHDLSAPGREMVQAVVEIATDAPPIRHLHPGEEIIYVLEGVLEYTVDGQGTNVYKAGQALMVPAGVVHAVRNVGDSPAAELATYVVEKGKPLLVPAP